MSEKNGPLLFYFKIPRTGSSAIAKTARVTIRSVITVILLSLTATVILFHWKNLPSSEHAHAIRISYLVSVSLVYRHTAPQFSQEAAVSSQVK